MIPTLPIPQPNPLVVRRITDTAAVFPCGKSFAVLADFVEVTDPAWEKACEAFLHDELEYVVVNGWSDAERGVELMRANSDGLTRTQIRDLFGRNRTADRIGVALSTLDRHHKAKMVEQETGGRPAETWFATV